MGKEIPAGSPPYVIDGAEVIKIGNTQGVNYSNVPTIPASAPAYNRNGNTPPATLNNNLFNYRR